MAVVNQIFFGGGRECDFYFFAKSIRMSILTPLLNFFNKLGGGNVNFCVNLYDIFINQLLHKIYYEKSY